MVIYLLAPLTAPARARRVGLLGRRLRWLACALLTAIPAHATIVGLNQIVTPDIQPVGVLAVSAQVEHPALGDSQEFQLELGITPRLEVAWFESAKNGEGFFDTEYNLLQEGPNLLTMGATNWSTRGQRPQPLLEYGHYTDLNHYVVGAIYANNEAELLVGYRRQLSERVQVSADFQSGASNAVTLGVVYNFTPDLSVNPAIYWTNSHPHHAFGYVVFTWNLTVWK
jgi:hypothetical protein